MATVDAPARKGLPPEAYEVVPGDQYEPYVPPGATLPELTLKALGIGIVLAAGLLTGAACGNDGASPEVETISQELFVETYVALRTVGLRSPNQMPSEEDRQQVLSEKGVTQEDLFTFVEVHGRNVEYMRDIWNIIEVRIEELRTPPDSGQGRS